MSAEERFEKNQKLVYFVIRKYFPYVKGQNEDLEQTGMLGLWRACLDYQEGKSAFSTFAACCIKNEIRVYLRKSRHKNECLTCQFSQLEDYEKEQLLYEPEFAVDETSRYFNQLNAEEKKLVLKIAQGEKTKDIAKEYGLARNTISHRTLNLRKKINQIREGTYVAKKSNKELVLELGIGERNFYRKRKIMNKFDEILKGN